MPLLRKLLGNHPLANVTYVLVLVMGLIAYFQLPRAQYPEINLNWVMIVTALPGASASDVEKRVAEPLEDAIRKVGCSRWLSGSLVNRCCGDRYIWGLAFSTVLTLFSMPLLYVVLPGWLIPICQRMGRCQPGPAGSRG